MLAIPAIDLKDGKAVRLVQGRYEEFTVYSHDPVETAKSWQREGASRIHLVDLDGAMSGEIKNLSVIRQIIENAKVPVQFGGGLRTREDVASILSIGAQWAILGTKPCEDLDFAKKIIAEFGTKIIVSVDVKFGKVAMHGWTNLANIEAADLINKLQLIGVGAFIYTDIARDGTLAGVNIEGVKKVLEKTGASIFYSGGISTMEDVKALKSLEKYGLAGIIIGKALYEDKIHLLPAIRALEGKLWN